MRSLSASTLAATAQTITEPRWFLQISFSTALRLTTSATTTWNSLTWNEADFVISGVGWASSIVQNVSITFGDLDQSIAALCLAQEITDLPIKLWAFDEKAKATADPVLIFDGAGANVSGADNGSLTITANRINSRSVDIPRNSYRILLPSELFAPAGTVIRWGNGTITLNPRSELT